MPKATLPSGDLIEINNCYIRYGNVYVRMKILPEISDSKSATYNDEAIIGRSSPMKTYSHSDNRTISWTAHFVTVTQQDKQTNLNYLRTLQSLVYPRDTQTGGAPYRPPLVCQIRCGLFLGKKELNVVLKRYSVKNPTEVAWDENNLAYKFDVDMEFDVVYDSQDLPGQEKILMDGM